MSVQHVYGLLRQFKKGCFLLLLLWAVASSEADGRFKIQAYRFINGSNEVTAASCWKDVAYAYLSVTWRLDGRPLDFATTSRFSSSTKTNAFSTHFWLHINPPLIGDNGTIVTCQPDGYKESDKALMIGYNFAPEVEAIGDADVRLDENSVFQPRVRIFFSGGNIDLMYYQNKLQLGSETNVDYVNGSKDVSLSPLKVLKGMSGPLSVLVSLDGLPFSYPIFNLTVISRAVVTPTAAAASPSSDDHSTKSSITSSATTLDLSPVKSEPMNPSTTANSAVTTATKTEITTTTTTTTTTATSKYASKSLLLDNDELLAIALSLSIFGTVLLVLFIVLACCKWNKACSTICRMQKPGGLRQDDESVQVRETGRHEANRVERRYHGQSCHRHSFATEDLANDVIHDQQNENKKMREEIRREHEKTRKEVRNQNEKTREKIRLSEASNRILNKPEGVSTVV